MSDSNKQQPQPPRPGKKPWSMKWIALFIVVYLIVYTYWRFK